MRKSVLAGALSIAYLTTGFGFQVQAQGHIEVSSIVHEKQLFAATNTIQVQGISYQDLYKMFIISKLEFLEAGMTLIPNKSQNSFVVKIPLKTILQSYEDGTNLYTEGEDEFRKSYEEFNKLFGEAIQLKFIQAGQAFKAEIYASGKWEALSGQDLDEFFKVINRVDFDLKAGGYFTDTIGHWAESYVQLLYQVGIINGTSETTFNPNGQVTRGQLAAMIFRTTGLDVDADYEGPATYTDLHNFWGAKEVAILQEYGLIGIFKGDTFEPNKPVTREEMAYVTASLLVAKGYDAKLIGMNNTFVDQGQMQEDTVKPIGFLQQLGLIGGDGGKFNPKGNLTRAQFSKIMALVLSISEE
ncbi:S-layer homology domain-containing protein [Solibacillus sp. FSL H8-0538]|uniref:S-layer homology domain-containing protein n=1 Tax=Solibacillus sp. FSL H8-0538 TaxID=2921400 RepID=UPI0030FCD4E7